MDTVLQEDIARFVRRWVPRPTRSIGNWRPTTRSGTSRRWARRSAPRSGRSPGWSAPSASSSSALGGLLRLLDRARPPRGRRTGSHRLRGRARGPRRRGRARPGDERLDGCDCRLPPTRPGRRGLRDDTPAPRREDDGERRYGVTVSMASATMSAPIPACSRVITSGGISRRTLFARPPVQTAAPLA